MDKILMLYYPLKDPVMSDPEAVLQAYYHHGCRIIEVSLPYENPSLDGQTVKDSMERIMKLSTIDGMFKAIRRIKQQHADMKIQVMSYIEIIESIGYERFAALCEASLVDYVLSPNASDTQLGRLDETFAKSYDIPVIRFLPYGDKEALLRKAKAGKGYLFMQSGNKKSGGYQEIGAGLQDKIAYLRKNNIKLPVIVGFGIKDYQQIKACHRCGADGVAIGSEVIHYIIKSEIESYLSSLTDMAE